MAELCRPGITTVLCGVVVLSIFERPGSMPLALQMYGCG
jgi:hypothetical protein